MVSMNFFSDTFDLSLDDKNRLNVPAKFRKIMAQLQETTFIMSSLEGDCLTLYPNTVFQEKIAQRLEKLPQLDDTANDLRRAVGMHSTEVPIDNQGRIIIPANFRERAGISKKVLMIGAMSKIELWDPETYEKDSRMPDKAVVKAELKKYNI